MEDSSWSCQGPKHSSCPLRSLPQGCIHSQEPWFISTLSLQSLPQLSHEPCHKSCSGPVSWMDLGLSLYPCVQPCLWPHPLLLLPVCPGWPLGLTQPCLCGAFSVNPALPTSFRSVGPLPHSWEHCLCCSHPGLLTVEHSPTASREELVLETVFIFKIKIILLSK